MPEKIAFTKTRLEAIPFPATGRTMYHDANTPNLCLRVSAGSKRFVYYGRIAGRPSKLLLGVFPAMSVEQARAACKRMAGAKHEGRDVAAERKAVRQEAVLKDLADHWLEHAKQRKKTWGEDERQYKTFLKPWANRRLSAIKKTDVQALHSRIGQKNGRYAANRMLALLRAMFNKADDIGHRGGNPTVGVKPFPEEKRDRFLHGPELKAFFDSLAAEPNELLRDFFLLLLLTGARRSNVQAMAWADLDLPAGLWRIPETKSGIPVVVPLTGPALTVLQKRLEASDDSPWVFPSHGRQGHIVEPKSAWARIVKRADLVDVRPHDLRRSLGSWMAMGGAGLPVVGKMLGHSQPSTTAIYARLSVDPVRVAAESATAAMLTAGGVKLLESKGGDDA
jgi:integrase